MAKPRKAHKKKKQNPIAAIFALIFLGAVAIIGISPASIVSKTTAISPTPAAIETPAAETPQPSSESETAAEAPQETEAPVPEVQAVSTDGETDAETADEPEAQAETAALYAVSLNPDEDVVFPFGLTAEYNAKSIDLSSLSGADITETAAIMNAMPALCCADLGAAKLSSSELALLCSSVDDVRLKYDFEIYGQSVNMRTETLDLTGLTQDAVAETAELLSCLPKLRFVNLGSVYDTPELTWEDIGTLESAAPDAVFDFNYNLCGREFSTADGVIDLRKVQMSDDGAAVREVMPYVYSKYLDLDSCGLSNEQIASIRDDFPGTKVVWRVSFAGYSVRTDVTRILASKPSTAGELLSSNVGALKYCTDVKYLDIGHNERLDTFDFAAYMPHLRAVIIAMDDITDISMLANCPHLEYLEIFSMPHLSDISVLAELSELKHLGIQHNPMLTDMSAIMDIELDRLWIGPDYNFPYSQIEEYMSRYPDCEINLTTTGVDMGTWRYTKYDIDTGVFTWVPRYQYLRDQMGYSMLLYSFAGSDPKA